MHSNESFPTGDAIQQASLNSQNLTVFVVDDNPLYLELIHRSLERSGIKCNHSRDPIEAIAKIEELKPAVVLLDIAMPVLNGWEVLDELKKRGCATRVIMCSAYHRSTADIVRCIRGGACDYISKPFTQDELTTSIKRVWAREAPLIQHLSDTAPITGCLLEQISLLEAKIKALEIEAAKNDSRQFWQAIIVTGIAISAVITGSYTLPIPQNALMSVGVVVLSLLLICRRKMMDGFSTTISTFGTRLKLSTQRTSELESKD